VSEGLQLAKKKFSTGLKIAQHFNRVKNLKVSFGVQRLSGKGDGRVVMNSRRKVVHKNFDPKMLENDIAIIKLPRKVPIGKQN
jgi:hypothetical protein